MRQLPGVGCGVTWDVVSGAAYFGQSLPMALGKAQPVELKLRCSMDTSHSHSALLLSAAGLLGSPAGQAPAQAPGCIQQLASCSYAKSFSSAKFEGFGVLVWPPGPHRCWLSQRKERQLEKGSWSGGNKWPGVGRARQMPYVIP